MRVLAEGMLLGRAEKAEKGSRHLCIYSVVGEERLQ